MQISLDEFLEKSVAVIFLAATVGKRDARGALWRQLRWRIAGSENDLYVSTAPGGNIP